MAEEKKIAKDATEGVEAVENKATEGADRFGIIQLKRPYTFEGKEYTEIDISGVEKLTVGDAIKAQIDLFGQENIATSLVTERTTAFARQIATMGSEYPIEFFKLMPRGTWKIVQREVVGVIQLSGEDTENHIMKFKKPYYFEGKEYTEIDLNGLADMTSMNESEAENRLVMAGVTITEPTYNYLYACIMASMATGQPEEFFKGLPISEVLELKAAVNSSDFFE